MISYKKIIKTLSTLLLGAGQEFVFQILSVLIWIRTWGVDLYSEWLILFILPNLLIRGNVGLFHSASSDMIALWRSKNYSQAAICYRSIGHAQCLLLSVVAILIFSIFLILLITEYFDQFSNKELILISILLFLQIGLFQWHQQLLCLLKATDKVTFSVMWQNAFRLSFILPLLIFPFILSPATCLAIAVFIQIIVALITWRVVNPIRKKIKAHNKGVHIDVIKRLLIKGGQFSAFPFLQTAVHTLSVWALGLYFEPVMGAVWHNLRTLSRALLIVSRAGEQAIRWELSSVLSKETIERVEKQVRKYFATGCTVIGFLAVILLISGEVIFSLLTNGEFQFDAIVFFLLCLGAFFYSLAQLYLSIPFSVNKHGKVTREAIVILGVVLCLIAPVSAYGLIPLAFIITVSDLMILVRSRINSYQILAAYRNG